MSGTNLNPLGKVLIFAAVVEVGTDLVLMIDPVIVGTLLLGVNVFGVGILLGRCFGIALSALGWRAGRARRSPGDSRRPCVRC